MGEQSADYRAFSYGGGIQSFATLLMQAQGKLEKPFDMFIFANVGDDSERAGTLKHIREVAIPLAEEHNITFKTAQKMRRNGEPATLLQEITGDNKSIRFPAYMSNGAPGNRSCTYEFKVKPVRKALKALWPNQHIEMGIGFSIDEGYRIAKKPSGWHSHEGKAALGFYQRYTFPLVDALMSRDECYKYIENSGYPIPPKSACWYCPFTGRLVWIEVRRNEPDVFWAAVELERLINEKRARIGKDAVYLHSSCTPLEQAVAMTPSLFDEFYDTDNECLTGVCGL